MKEKNELITILKMYAWVLILVGCFCIYEIIDGYSAVPLWKQVLSVLLYLVGGISLLVFTHKLWKDIRYDSYTIRKLKEGKAFSLFLIVGSIMLFISGIGNKDGSFMIYVKLSSIMFVIGMAGYFLSRHVLKKKLNEI